MHNIFSTRGANLGAEWQKMVNKARFKNYVVAYNALRLQCESEYDRFMNVNLWRDILAIIRAVMIPMWTKKSGKFFWKKRTSIVHKESAKRKNREMQAEAELKKKQMSARDQCVDLIEGEFSKDGKVCVQMQKYFSLVSQMKTFRSRFLWSKTSMWVLWRLHKKKFHSQNQMHSMGLARIIYQLLQKEQNLQHRLQLIQLRKSTTKTKKKGPIKLSPREKCFQSTRPK
jgi:hypothetical protein